MTNVNVSRETHSRPTAPAGIGACVTTLHKVNNRAAEGARAAVVREVVADGAGGGSGMKVCTDVATKERGKCIPKWNGRPARRSPLVERGEVVE